MTLKDIPPDNKGLPNLPKSVRNNMGYKKKGGTVKARDGKFMTRKEMAGASQMPKLNRS